MTSRILSQHGNVIAADFRPRSIIEISLSLATETLYHDGHITLIRSIASIDGRPAFVSHILADLTNGHIVTL